jgi:CheY-like chemotaxis protein
MVMPEMDGWTFIERLRDRYRAEVPVYIASATPALPRSLSENVVAGTFRKPYDVMELASTVASAAKQRRQTPRVA